MRIASFFVIVAAVTALPALASAQVSQPRASLASATSPSPRAPGAVTNPEVAPGYVIGPEDVLSIVFWRDKDMSADVAVRPDGKISLPLLNEVHAAGLTPMQLRDQLTEQAKRYVEDPTVSVVVRQINSQKIFVTGQVIKPGPYALTGPTTVLQVLAIAGGFKEYADEKHVTVVRTENGRTVAYPFNYKDVSQRRNLGQNIELRAGDTIIVP
jgi:polysaccharide export outer membrane protein